MGPARKVGDHRGQLVRGVRRGHVVEHPCGVREIGHAQVRPAQVVPRVGDDEGKTRLLRGSRLDGGQVRDGPSIVLRGDQRQSAEIGNHDPGGRILFVEGRELQAHGVRFPRDVCIPLQDEQVLDIVQPRAQVVGVFRRVVLERIRGLGVSLCTVQEDDLQPRELLAHRGGRHPGGAGRSSGAPLHRVSLAVLAICQEVARLRRALRGGELAAELRVGSGRRGEIAGHQGEIAQADDRGARSGLPRSQEIRRGSAAPPPVSFRVRSISDRYSGTISLTGASVRAFHARRRKGSAESRSPSRNVSAPILVHSSERTAMRPANRASAAFVRSRIPGRSLRRCAAANSLPYATSATSSCPPTSWMYSGCASSARPDCHRASARRSMKSLFHGSGNPAGSVFCVKARRSAKAPCRWRIEPSSTEAYGNRRDDWYVDVRRPRLSRAAASLESACRARALCRSACGVNSASAGPGKELVQAVDAQGIAFQAVQGKALPQGNEGEVPRGAVADLDVPDELHRVAVPVQAVQADGTAVLHVGDALGQRVGGGERIVGFQRRRVVLPEIPALRLREKIVLRGCSHYHRPRTEGAGDRLLGISSYKK